MASRQRTAVEKTGDWFQVFTAIREEVTPPALRTMLSTLQGVDGATTPEEAIKVLQSSMALARLISANDRAAAIVAAMLTSSGVQRPVIDVGDDE